MESFSEAFVSNYKSLQRYNPEGQGRPYDLAIYK